MKKCAFLLALVMAVAFAGPVAAAELKAKGAMQVEGVWMDNWDFVSMKHGAASEDDFQIAERARIQFDFIANENLKGVVQLQIGTGRWGNGGFTIGQGDGGVALSTSLRTRQAYLTYFWPETDVAITGGYFSLNLPAAATGNRILDEEVAALSISAPIIKGTISLVATYGRPYDINLGYGLTGGDGMTKADDEMDIFSLAAPLTFDGFSFTPYGMYAIAGKDALNAVGAGSQGQTALNLRGLSAAYFDQAVFADGNAAYSKHLYGWWGGFAFDMTLFDPFLFQLDFAYGSVDTNIATRNRMGKKAADREGWYVDFALTYDGLGMVTPKLFFAYGSGDDDDISNGSERMPFIRAGSHGFGSFYYGYGSSFAAADMSDSTGNDTGQWVLGLGLENITYMDKLSHDFYVMYIQGTNDHDYVENAHQIPSADGDVRSRIIDNGLYGYYLTTKDHLVEVDLNTKYMIFDELACILELGAIFAHLDSDVWGISGNGDNAFKAAFGLKYSF